PRGSAGPCAYSAPAGERVRVGPSGRCAPERRSTSLMSASQLVGLGAAGHAGALAAAQELRGHLAAGLVDHLVAEHDRAPALAGVALGRRLLVRLEEVDGVVELLLRGREHLVDDRHLVGMQRPLAVVAENAGPHRVLAQSVELADLEVRAVDDLEAVGASG